MQNPIRLVSGALILAFTLTSSELVSQDKPLRGKAVPADVVKQDYKVKINDADYTDVYAMVGDAKIASAIIAAKPYRSVEDLSKIFSADVVNKIKTKIVFDDSMLDGAGRGIPTSSKININAAGLDALVGLPTVDAAMAKRIIDARYKKPFWGSADLQQRARLPGDVMQKIATKIVFDDSMLDGAGRGVPTSTKVNINAAGLDAVVSLQDVDFAMASRIIDARKQKPFSDAADLQRRANVPGDVLKKNAGKIVFDDSMLDGAGRGVPTPTKVNINAAGLDAVVSLQDVDFAMASRIIDARKQKPFSDAADLQRRANVPGDVLKKNAGKIVFDDSMLDGAGRGVPTPTKVNINAAGLDAVVSLQDVDFAMASRIIDARTQKPFSDAADLQRRANVPGDVLKKNADKIVFDDSMLDGAGRGLGDDSPDSDHPKLDINSADWSDIAKLPEVGDVLGQKIVRARPFGDAADLAKIVPDWVAWKVMPKITISEKPAWPIDASFKDDGSSFDIVLHATSGGYEFRVDQVAQNGPVATVHCTVTVPGRNEATTDDTPDLTVEVRRSDLGARTSTVKVMVSAEERGVHYFVKPRYEAVTTVSTPKSK